MRIEPREAEPPGLHNDKIGVRIEDGAGSRGREGDTLGSEAHVAKGCGIGGAIDDQRERRRACRAGVSRGLGARGWQDPDPCRRLWRIGLRAQHMGQTWRLWRKGWRSPYSQGQAGGGRTLVGERLRSAAQAELRYQRSCHRQAHDHARMRDGRIHMREHELEPASALSEIRFRSEAQRADCSASHPRQFTNNSTPAAASVAIATR
jgi:hypothetical protein